MTSAAATRSSPERPAAWDCPINPGPVRTAFSRSLWDSEEKTGKLEAIIPMRRIGEADDVAGLALLLASPAGRCIHGQNISVDSGLTA